MISTEIAVTVFAACNSVRLLAYLPQIVSVARDASGARAISCTTWSMFAVSHLSTALYAAAVLGDRGMAAVFTANMLCSLAIVAITICKRRGAEAAGKRPAGAAVRRDGSGMPAGLPRLRPTPRLALAARHRLVRCGHWSRAAALPQPAGAFGRARVVAAAGGLQSGPDRKSDDPRRHAASRQSPR